MPRWVDNEVWMQIDALAAHYERINGVRSNRLHIGQAVALEIEGPQADGHPLHLNWESPTSGVWFPARPAREARWWDQFRLERACKRHGGHWWHPADAMIEWFCCRCGKDRDGTPQDGT